MSSWGLLDDAEENELHKARLVNIEEKPFKRITKRLATISTIITEKAAQQPTPPPDGSNGAETSAPAADPAALRHERALLKEDLALDFAAFDSSIARLQFLLDANERERQRYAADQQRILDECQAVRDNNAALRERLEVARGTLRQRKAFDRLADDITNKGMLRPRDDQRVALQKLEEECAELERESGTYNDTWSERKEQFARIMEEAMRLRRQIRDEKEEVERREGMNEDGEEDGEVSRAGGSRGTTPRADGDAGTPRPNGTSGGRTPARDSQTEEGHGLKPRPDGLGSLSRGGSNAPSQAGTPRHQADDDDDEIEEGEDVEMDDPVRPTYAHNSGGETPQITVDGPGGGDRMEVDH
ncbi:hypothetical protein ACHAQA_002857 [Verticillium albo-atrum]